MAKTANELLQGILSTVVKIEKKIDQSSGDSKKEASSNVKGAFIAGSLASFNKVDEKTQRSFISFMKNITDMVKGDKGKNFDYFSQGIMKVSNALPILIKNLIQLGNLKTQLVSKALSVLKGFYDFMYDMGNERKTKRIDNAISVFDKMGKSFEKMAKPLKSISTFLLYLSAGIVAFAASLLLTSMILRLSKPGDVFTFLGFTIISLTLMFGALALADKFVKKGTNVIKDMGIGLSYLSLGIFSFVFSMILTTVLLKMTKPSDLIAFLGLTVISLSIMFGVLALADKFIGKGIKATKDIGIGMAFLSLGIFSFAFSLLLTTALLKMSKPGDVLTFLGFTVISIVLLFGALAFAEKLVDRGTNTIKDIGIGMAFLSLGLIAFALTIKLIPYIMGKESGGSIAGSLLLMGLIIGSAIGLFALMGAAESLIKKGSGVVFLMSLGLLVLSGAMIAVATAAKYLQGGSLSLGEQKGSKEEKDDNKKMIMKGLGTFGLILLAAVAAFALLGIPYVAGIVITGVGVAIGISIALILLSLSIAKLSKTAKSLEKENIGEQIAFLVGGTIEGLLKGFGPLTGGKSGLKGVGEFIKNSYKIFAGLAVLMAMSLTLSMFAFAISAFAELENMRVINGYDKNGRPIFGEKINVRNVANNVSYSIKTFLEALLVSTENLTTTKAKALKKLGRALTGRRGILAGLHDFADVLKTFSQFGPAGEIGYVEMVPDGTDEDGNAKFKQVPRKVKIIDVASNIANSFGTFVDQLVKHTSIFELSGEKGRSMMKLATILMGSKAYKFLGLSFGREKPGLLEPITKFSEILNQYASFGDGKKIPILDSEGKVKNVISVSDIAKNIINTLGEFSRQMGNQTVLSDTEKAEKNIGKFSDLMESTSKITESLDGMSKLSLSVKDLAEGIGLLAINVDKLNTEKLNQILTKTASSSSKIVLPNSPRIEETEETYRSKRGSSNKSSYNQEDWEQISQLIGDQVGAKVAAALRNGQFTFEFSSSSNKEGIFYMHPR